MSAARLHQLAFLSALLVAASAAFAGDLPDLRLTPGVTNPEITQANVRETVCIKGFTKTIRPPAYYTNHLKKLQIRQYGYADRNPRDYEEDHLIALSLGGSPTDERNLWPEPRNSEWGADKKDELEFVLYKKVCAGQVSLAQAQHDMATNWIEAYKLYMTADGRRGRAD